MPVFLDDGGECGALIKARDWSDTLGPVEKWPQSLKAATGLLLRSPVPIAMLWGDDGIMLYNDAYSVIAGGRHPDLLGSKVREGWPEVAEFNDHVMKVGLAGGTLSFRDQELVLHRHGRPEKVWMDLDYSPAIGDDGRPAGVLAIVIETTARVAAERALQARAERLDLFDRLSRAINDLAAPDEIMAVTARLLGQHLKASIVAYADMEVDQDAFTIRGDWSADGSQSIVGSYSLDTFGATAARRLRGNTPLVIRDVLFAPDGTVLHEESWEVGSIAGGEGVELAYETRFSEGAPAGMYLLSTVAFDAGGRELGTFSGNGSILFVPVNPVVSLPGITALSQTPALLGGGGDSQAGFLETVFPTIPTAQAAEPGNGAAAAGLTNLSWPLLVLFTLVLAGALTITSRIIRRHA